MPEDGKTYRDKRGKWCIRIWWEGKRHDIYRFMGEHTMPDQAAAEYILNAIRMEIKEGRFNPAKHRRGKPLSVSGYYAAWIARKEKSCERGTIHAYRWAFEKHILPAIGETFLPNVTSDTLLDLRDGMDLAPKSKKNVLDSLRVLVRDAADAGILQRVPKFPAMTGRNTVRRAPVAWLSNEDQWEIMAHVQEKHRPIFIFMKLTGVRTGEARALKRKDIDRENGVIYIRQAMGMDQEDIKTPKTGPREIPLPDAVITLLDSMPKSRWISEWAFPNPRTGRPYSKNVYKYWEKACASAGAKYVKPYAAFRHSFASQLAQAGVADMTIRALMGHADIRTTTIYTHHKNPALKAVVDRLQRLPSTDERLDARKKKG